ncbi:hypothetical protein VPNG_05595 [Cytospora leucostoma]|uniref:Uncharacterized protein n=1 Tax=Cytospora leucostoma TaxID=1230097 RepID=A0A423X6P5_9PEZI|nr:hypothetical protein VPNG_05595 [Cytospora leucostoma]
MAIDKVTKKKVSEDKVTKHEGKQKNPVRRIKSEDSDDEISKGSIEQEGGASLVQGDDDSPAFESSETRGVKKHRKKEERFREEALQQLMGEDSGLPAAASGVHVATESERKNKQNEKRKAKRALERQMAKEATASSSDVSIPAHGDDDLVETATPITANVETLRLAPSEDEDMEDGGAPLQKKRPGYTAPPSGVNRAVRRRFMLIEREKAKIKKQLGIPEGSTEKAEEVDKLLDQFTKRLDAKTAERESKKMERRVKPRVSRAT